MELVRRQKVLANWSIRSPSCANRTTHPLYVTSIKANIGHLEAASGAAGLLKRLLMLQHRMIPRQILLENPNPKNPSLDCDRTIMHVSWHPPVLELHYSATSMLLVPMPPFFWKNIMEDSSAHRDTVH